MKRTEMVRTLIDTLDHLQIGTEISTVQLLEKSGYDVDALSPGDLFAIYDALMKAAEKEGFVLDFSKYENKDVGLIYNLRFTIKDKMIKTCGGIKGIKIETIEKPPTF